MDELITLVSQKTGNSNDQAKVSVTTVLPSLKEIARKRCRKDGLPFGGRVSTNVADGLGGLFSKK